MKKTKPSNWSMILVIPLGIWALLVSGCGLGDIHLDLPLEQASTHHTGGNGRVLIIPKVKDERTIKDRIGMKKAAGSGQDIADITANTDLSDWLTSRLRAEFTESGFQVVDKGPKPGVVEMNVMLLKYFIEPVDHFTTIAHEADVHIRVQLKRSDGLVAERNYYVKGIYEGWVGGVSGPYAVAQQEAVKNMMERLVPDVIFLLNKYPMTG